jgi:hypothetical protein
MYVVLDNECSGLLFGDLRYVPRRGAAPGTNQSGPTRIHLQKEAGRYLHVLYTTNRLKKCDQANPIGTAILHVLISYNSIRIHVRKVLAEKAIALCFVHVDDLSGNLHSICAARIYPGD